MTTAITTTAKVKSYLGITSTTYDTIIGNLVDAVNESIERYCNRTFGKGTYFELQFGSDFLREPSWPYLDDSGERSNGSVNYPTIAKEGEKLILNNTPINTIYYASYGMQSVIRVRYDGNSTGTIEVLPTDKIILSENFTQTEIDFDTTWSINDVAVAINAESNWTAELTISQYTTYPAKSIIFRTYGPIGSQGALGDFQIYASVSTMGLIRDEDGLYRANVRINSTNTILVIYDGGYESDDLPAGLVEIATKAAADAYSSIDREADLKEEDIGDYSYKKFDTGSYSYINAYLAQLDMYRRIPMGV